MKKDLLAGLLEIGFHNPSLKLAEVTIWEGRVRQVWQKKNVCKERLNFTIRLSITKCFFMLQKVNHSLSLSVAVGFASRPRTIFNGG